MMSDEEAALILAGHARGSLAPFVVFDERTGLHKVDLSTDEAKANLHLVKKVKQRKRLTRTKDGKTVATIEHDVELHDAQSAAKDIRRAHGAYGAKGTEESPHVVEHRHYEVELPRPTDSIAGDTEAASADGND